MARRFQFSLKSLMAAVAVICLGLGGWHLLFRQYVEADPAVVGQPIKIHGRFVRFSEEDEDAGWNGRYDLFFDEVLDSGSHSWVVTGIAEQSFGCRYDVEIEVDPVHEPTEFTLELMQFTGQSIYGKLVVRPAD